MKLNLLTVFLRQVANKYFLWRYYQTVFLIFLFLECVLNYVDLFNYKFRSYSYILLVVSTNLYWGFHEKKL